MDLPHATSKKEMALAQKKRVIILNAKEFTDKHTLLGLMAKALNFPAYFGYNWDALLDCLRDLDDFLPSENGWLLAVDFAKEFKNNEQLFPVFSSVLDDAVQQRPGFEYFFVDR